MSAELNHQDTKTPILSTPGLGVIEPDPVGIALGTGYSRFSSPLGIEGLAKEENNRVDILAVVALDRGKGHFRNFIRHCQDVYQTVCVWEDWNPFIGAALARYGFRPAMETDEFGETINGWRWDKTSEPSLILVKTSTETEK